MSDAAEREPYGERLRGLVKTALDKGDPRGLLKTAISPQQYEEAVQSLAGKLLGLPAKPTRERLKAMAQDALAEMASAGSLLETAIDYAQVAQMIADGLGELADALDIELP